ncbi:MAG TPA: hypothetical protein VJX95_00790 [Oscillospiraceae bacterium]|nr:hypothetical protein [Oscillospiraceae bacterium]
MLSRPVFFFIVSVSFKRKKLKKNGKPRRFRLILPMPMYLLVMLLDIADDFVELGRLLSFGAIKRLKWEMLTNGAIKVSKAVLFELVFDTGPLDLVDVDCGDKENNVKVRCLLR